MIFFSLLILSHSIVLGVMWLIVAVLGRLPAQVL